MGKSTLINRLVGRRGLARTSSTPGRTRRIHFYRVEDRAYVVDLPGYGYASGSKVERAAFAPLVESYLSHARAPLRGALVLVDARRGAQDEERELVSYLAAERIEARIALTKCDNSAAPRWRKARRALGGSLRVAVEAWRRSPAATKITGSGRWPAGWLEGWSGLPFRRPDGAAF